MEHQHRLRPGIAICSFDDVVVVLDVSRDRYFRLGGPLASALEWVAGTASTAIGEGEIERLTEMGLIEACVEAIPRIHFLTVPEPLASAIEGRPEESEFSLTMALSVAWWTFLGHALLRTRRLDRLLSGIGNGRGKCRGLGSPAGDVAALARSFWRYRSFVPITPVCLPDSLGLLKFLARRGHAPHLVMAVTAHPFAAHCWVQAEGLVLNDALDHASLFKPILIV